MQSDETDGSRFVAGFFLAALALMIIPLAIIGVVKVAQDDGDAVATATSTTASISLAEFSISGDLTVPAGDVTLAVTNEGTAQHNLQFDGSEITPTIDAGGTATLALGSLGAGTYPLICTIPGHADSGMRADLVVADDSGIAQPDTTTDHGGHEGDDIDYAALDAAMTASILKFPAATEGKGNQPLTPTILADGTKQFTLTAEITDWEVEPGKVVEAWSYNGQVPGPEIRVAVGDKVRVVLENKLPMGTDVHHHGLDLPFAMDGVAPITQKLVAPGESFNYDFTATTPAVAMYHAHSHGHMQVPNGLFGPFIVETLALPRGRTVSGITIPADLQVAREIPMVLNDAGVIGLSLNGKSFPATEPYAVKSGEWLLVHYFNEGLQSHPMHQHQFPQLVVARDGIPLDQPYWVDTVSVAPGERYSVLINPNKAGTWVWHCHILNHVERDTGMFGMVTALVVSD